MTRLVPTTLLATGIASIGLFGGITSAGDDLAFCRTSPFFREAIVRGDPVGVVTSVAVADFDGDGRDEIIALDGSTSQLRIFDATASVIGPPRDLETLFPTLSCVGAADVNGDGAVDLIRASFGQSAIVIRLGDGAGGFGGFSLAGVAGSLLCVPDQFTHFAIVPRLESSGGSTLIVPTFDGISATSIGADGSTEDPMLIRTGSFSRAVSFDVDADGTDDVVVGGIAGSESGWFRVEPGGSLGAFALLPGTGSLQGVTGVVVADVDGNGVDDLVLTRSAAMLTAVTMLYDSDGSVREVVESESIREVLGQPVVRDVDGDGIPDLVSVGGASIPGIRVHRGDGAGGFSYRWTTGTGLGSRFAIAGDVDGDGRTDIVSVTPSADPVDRLIVIPGQADRLTVPDMLDIDRFSWFLPPSVVVRGADSGGLLAGDALVSGFWDFVWAGGLTEERVPVRLFTSGKQIPVGFGDGDRFDARTDPAGAIWIAMTHDQSGGDGRLVSLRRRVPGADQTDVVGLGLAGDEARHVAMIDLDADGTPEMVVQSEDGRRMVVFGVDQGDIAPVGDPIVPGPGTDAERIDPAIIEDLDGDGLEDVVVIATAGPRGIGGAWVAYGTPAGSLEPFVELRPGGTVFGVGGGVMAELDGVDDGARQLVRYADETADALVVLRHLGQRTYAADAIPLDDPAGFGALPTLVPADLDGDGIDELAASGDPDSIRVIWDVRAPAVGGPAEVIRFPRGRSLRDTSALLAADLDGDGRDDLISRERVLFSRPCADRCSADLDANDSVGFGDLTILLGGFGQASFDGFPGSADLDRDGVVGFGDLTRLLAAWGPCREGG